MHLLGRSCTCNPHWEVVPSKEKDPPSWNGYKECACSISLSLSQGEALSPFLGLQILNLETDFLCWVGLILLHLSLTFPEVPSPQFCPDSLKLSWEVLFEMVLIEMESDIPLLALKWRDRLLTFPSFSGNTEDDLLAKNSACSLHITTFLSKDVCEDNLVCWVFPLLREVAYNFYSFQIRSLAPYLSVGYWVSSLIKRAGWQD